MQKIPTAALVAVEDCLAPQLQVGFTFVLPSVGQFVHVITAFIFLVFTTVSHLFGQVLYEICHYRCL